MEWHQVQRIRELAGLDSTGSIQVSPQHWTENKDYTLRVVKASLAEDEVIKREPVLSRSRMKATNEEKVGGIQSCSKSAEFLDESHKRSWIRLPSTTAVAIQRKGARTPSCSSSDSNCSLVPLKREKSVMAGKSARASSWLLIQLSRSFGGLWGTLIGNKHPPTHTHTHASNTHTHIHIEYDLT